ncbi:hypothetical protein FRC12_009876 [Ceratobasidium sp. 428]|nr:hypothetical protein FRC12_009876 [Ceratobasidium sp. 428]
MLVELVPRSTGGCLTCKRRKKKCDETKPCCRRCLGGDFRCLGYEDPAPQLSNRNSLEQDVMAIPELPPALFSSERPEYEVEIIRLPETQGYWYPTSRTRTVPRLIIPANFEINPAALCDMYSLIVAQYARLAPRIIFRPFRFSIEASVIHEIEGSKMKLWALYLGAKITQTLLGDRDENYGSLVERFHERIRTVPILVEMSASELGLRLSCLQDLMNFAIMIFDSRAGYHLFKATVPIFLQLASQYPYLWSQNSTISIFHALYAPQYHIRKFVLWDTMTSLAFASPPVLQYDTQPTTSLSLPKADPVPEKILEWVYGCPQMIVMFIAKINGWRTGGLGSGMEYWRELERKLQLWVPVVDRADDSTGRVMRLAVQEAWRHVVLIYLYMGMCGVDSADPRVELAVEQVVQLASTVTSGNLLENHLFMPCLIAGVAARYETHRSIVRNKLNISTGENIWCLRGADFVPVLDHLWHGAGADGQPTAWEDYALTRRVVLPVDV